MCWNALAGSILIVTVNANRNFYRKGEGTEKLSVEESLLIDFGKLVPSPFPVEADTRPGFPKLLGKMLRDHLSRTVLAGRKSLEILPLFDFSYEDGSPMVTVGGILCDTRLRAECVGSPAFTLDYVGKTTQYRIQVPPLTFREKHAIDQLLPALQPPLAESLQKALRFSLAETQIENYRKFYPYYPLFWELFA
ncbi:MAG: O-methyltransferase [Verrucomicrobiota bacterium]